MEKPYSISTAATHDVEMPLAFVRRQEPQPSAVFDTYWRFAAKRQAIYHRRARGEPGPWDSDPILHVYKFTNPYRAADRVSQYLIRHVIYGADLDFASTVLRTLLFKVFNKIETWELLEHEFGEISTANFSPASFGRVLANALDAGASIYSGAYIMPSGPASIRRARKHEMHLALLESLMKDGFPNRLAGCKSMQSAYALLRTVPGIGPFLAYQFVTDLNYGPSLSFTEMEFVVPGPGARDGLRKCFTSFGDYAEADVIRWVTDRQDAEFQTRDLAFESLWGRPLQLIDCQNLFCEVDKYSRVAHPEALGLTGRTRIKQRFVPNRSPLPPPWFPPKWGLNDRILRSVRPAPSSSSRAPAYLHPA
jgi:hypothetical protein